MDLVWLAAIVVCASYAWSQWDMRKRLVAMQCKHIDDAFHARVPHGSAPTQMLGPSTVRLLHEEEIVRGEGAISVETRTVREAALSSLHT